MPATKILIVGSGGAGKSTLARQLGSVLGLPVVHLDQHFWRPGWVEPPASEWRERVAELVAAPAWIMDGNYGGTFDLRIPSADLVVFLDLPRRITFRRVVLRAVRDRGRSRPDMAPGCPERLSPGFLAWIWSYPGSGRRRLLAAIEECGARERTVRLRTAKQVRAWLAAQSAP